MMKKILVLVVFASVFFSLSAQNVNETVVFYGKEQIKGFTINIYNNSSEIVEGALVDKFETQYKLKGSKKKGYHVYENQTCDAFGDARYDIYFTTVEVGKKKDRTTQVILVVSTGNLNCITFTNDPRSSRNIVAFLEHLNTDIESYKIKLRIEELRNNLNNLNKDRQSMLKEQTKLQEKRNISDAEVKRLTEQIEQSSNAEEKESLQKSLKSAQKTLQNLDEKLYKIGVKLETNQKDIDSAQQELDSLTK
jgi:molecular chaperone DnaK (HSP70)